MSGAPKTGTGQSPKRVQVRSLDVFDFRPRIMTGIPARNSLCRLGPTITCASSSSEDCEGYLEEREEEAVFHVRFP
jgi:hypothetical protein